MTEKCWHRNKEKVPKTDKVKCLDCSKVYTPKDAPVRHGTYRGYAKHLRERKGRWPWPALEECGCMQAGRDFRKHQANLPENKRNRAVREAARKRALSRIRMTFPGLFAAIYSQEMGADRPTVHAQAHVPMWDDLMARLLKEATGRDETELAERVRSRMATPREREVMRLATRLRVLFSAREA